MAYRVEFRPRADKQLQALPRSVQLRVVAALTRLEDDPRPHGVRKLKGADDFYRIRVGDYRVVYQIHDDRLLVLVIRIGHRRDIYEGGK